MDSSLMNAEGNQPRLRVSISARLIPVLCYTIPVLGGALSSFFMMRVIRALRTVENAGAGAIIAGMAEAIIPVLGSLYLGAICGIAVITVLVVRMFTQTKTASPPSWFFVISGLLIFVPAGLFAEAESLIIEVLINPRESSGLVGVASDIGWLLNLSVAAAPIIFLILTILSVVPLTSRSRTKWGPLLTAAAIEILIIAVAIAFQMRYLWLFGSVTAEGM